MRFFVILKIYYNHILIKNSLIYKKYTDLQKKNNFLFVFIYKMMAILFVNFVFVELIQKNNADKILGKQNNNLKITEIKEI
jgi:hypothetical protein